MLRKILIIDDDIELLKMLKKYFTLNAADQYEIITAQNGMEGIDKINAQPDLILLDINMPKIDVPTKPTAAFRVNYLLIIRQRPYRFRKTHWN